MVIEVGGGLQAYDWLRSGKAAEVLGYDCSAASIVFAGDSAGLIF